MNKLSIEEFIKRSNIIHNNVYDYSKSIYVNSKKKVHIICKKHGDFYQIPNSHLVGKGCPKCNGGVRLTTFDFIKRANLVHNNIYLYEKTVYKDIKTKVIITCIEHGDFYQTPDNHLNGDYRISSGNGCPACNKKVKLSNEEFINKSKVIHNDKYLYDKTIYIHKKEKVIIQCRKHGYFLQNIYNHLAGNGCARCNNSKGELKIESILKLNNMKYKTQFTFKNLIYKKPLKFDFMIFNNDNLKCLIEFNGIQHYEFRKKFHKSENDYINSKFRDQLKIDYCKENNIKLYIIRYDDDLEVELEKIIKENE
jgi:hypothetical protein